MDKKLAPAALLTVGRRNHHGFVVRFAGVIVDRSCGLGAEVAGLGVEVQSADAVGTVRASKPHAALDALDSVGFHCLNCNPQQPDGEYALVGQRR
jgi:hypothetical protein